MQAVILAAGLGTRMGRLTEDTPKPLLRIGNRTIIEQSLESLPEEIGEVVVVIGYLGDKIKQFLGKEFGGKKIKYVMQAKLKGTADALFRCKDFLYNDFLVLMGDDIYSREDLSELTGKTLAILTLELQTDDVAGEKHAIVKTDEAGNVMDIVERQPGKKGDLVNAGAYMLNTEVFQYPQVKAGNQTEEFGLPQTFMQMIRAGAKMQVVKAKNWRKITSPEDLK
ncbi:MAG: nucleotidyltransferase family protein [Candidatus Doudnabacteria bacterium]|nr:nucleotidyltransferase family protein [Candidatus Doudnabacteria bacterium]